MSARYGTWRGFVRLRLTEAELLLGRASVRDPDPAAVRRLVFVCHGNICRSAHAEGLARAAGLAAASFGLSAEGGKPAHPPIAAIAAERGLDLGPHRATACEAYVARDGDLLLAMETRQLRRIAADPRLAALPRTLLGLHTRPACAHLHDPYALGEPYMRRCLARIESAMPVLAARYPNARA